MEPWNLGSAARATTKPGSQARPGRANKSVASTTEIKWVGGMEGHSIDPFDRWMDGRERKRSPRDPATHSTSGSGRSAAKPAGGTWGHRVGEARSTKGDQSLGQEERERGRGRDKHGSKIRGEGGEKSLAPLLLSQQSKLLFNKDKFSFPLSLTYPRTLQRRSEFFSHTATFPS